MAVKTFEEIVAGLQLSADERKIFDNAIAKSSELKDGWLRQDDYSRNMTEISAKKKRLDELEAYETRMKPWSDEVYKKLETFEQAGIVDKEGNELWTKTKTQLEQDLEAARKQALAGGDMKPEEIDERVKAIVKQAGGGLSREEITALYAAESKKMIEDGFKEREAKFNSETIPFIGGFASSVAVVASRFERETGEKWTAEKQQELFKLMGDKQVFDPFKLEDDILAPHKAKKAEEDRIQTEVNKRLAQMGMPEGGGERFIPHGGDTSTGVGSLQAALKRSGDATGDLDTFIKSQAVKAGTELRNEGKF